MAQDVFANDTLFTGNVTMAGTASLPASSVSTTALTNNNVTAGKLTTTLATGFIPLSLHDVREIFTNDYTNAAGNGGLLAKDTTPIIEQVNLATDPQTRVKWAATNVDPVKWSLASPPDLDSSQPVILKLRARMSGGVDTPTFTTVMFEDVGGSNLGGATGALSSTLSTVTRSHTVTAVAGTPKAWSISITPGAHGTDAVELYCAWLEYTRK